MRRALAAAAVTALVLTGCAAEDEPSTSEETSPTASESPSASATIEPSPSPSADDTGQGDDDPGDDALEIEIEGGNVEPNGKRVKVSAGEPVVLEIESDRAAELHVHSSPEQVLQVKRGKSRIELTITTPGVVDVEEHETAIVVLQLEVR